MRSRQRFSDMYGQGCQGEAGLFLLIHACKLHTYAHKPGVRLFKVCVVCLLVTLREVPGEGLSVLAQSAPW